LQFKLVYIFIIFWLKYKAWCWYFIAANSPPKIGSLPIFEAISWKVIKSPSFLHLCKNFLKCVLLKRKKIVEGKFYSHSICKKKKIKADFRSSMSNDNLEKFFIIKCSKTTNCFEGYFSQAFLKKAKSAIYMNLKNI